MKKKIFIICPVRKANKQMQLELEMYAEILEQGNCIVHLPHRDTNQRGTSLEICTENTDAIRTADEVRVFYMENSSEIHFYLGSAFALKKKVVFIKSYSKEKPKTSKSLKFIEEYQEISKTL